jgi:hypothetical protein
MVSVKDDVEQNEFAKILQQLERLQEVDFADPVVGDRDIVVMVEVPISVEAFAKKLGALPWMKSLSTLRIVGIHERHRGSKRELLRALQTIAVG